MRRLMNLPTHYLAFIGLGVYGIVLTIITGNIGFQGDDWWLLSVPYWEEFPSSIWVFPSEFQRPFEGVYWITLFEVFGFNKPIFHFFSLLLLGLSSMLMGACLQGVFPRRRVFITCSVLFAFFLPMISCLTYVVHMDASRLCMLLFWGSVLSFQYWTKRSSSWMGLAVPVLLYYAATLTYEAANLLIFTVPLFVWPIRLRHQDNLSQNEYLFRLGIGIVAGFLLFILTRFVVFALTGFHAFTAGAAGSIQHLIPPLDLVISYLTTLPHYILAPFTAISTDAWTWVIGILVMLFTASLLFRRGEQAKRIANDRSMKRESSLWYALLLGIVILGLGVLPYLVAGYGAGIGFKAESRIYSASSFGLAILLSLLITGWRAKRLLLGAKIAAVIVIAFMAMFHADLRRDWQDASRIRQELWATFLEVAPGVTPGTTFLFLDLQSYIGNRAVVFQGTNGLQEFIRILYKQREVNAFYLYPYEDNFVDSEGRLAMASPDGVIARGSDVNNPIPHESLLIFERRGSRLVLLDSIAADDKLAAISWDGISILLSNPNRIVRTGGIEGSISNR